MVQQPDGSIYNMCGDSRFRCVTCGKQRHASHLMVAVAGTAVLAGAEIINIADMAHYGDAKFACCGKSNEATPTCSLKRALGAMSSLHRGGRAASLPLPQQANVASPYAT